MEEHRKAVDEELARLSQQNSQLLHKLRDHDNTSEDLHFQMKEAADKMRWTVAVGRVMREEQ